MIEPPLKMSLPPEVAKPPFAVLVGRHVIFGLTRVTWVPSPLTRTAAASPYLLAHSFGGNNSVWVRNPSPTMTGFDKGRYRAVLGVDR
jgi:hypothetical protein